MAGRQGWQGNHHEALGSSDVQSTHLRPMVSRFGGMINEGHSAAIPKQTWEVGKHSSSVHDFNTRHAASISNVQAGGV